MRTSAPSSTLIYRAPGDELVMLAPYPSSLPTSDACEDTGHDGVDRGSPTSRYLLGPGNKVPLLQMYLQLLRHPQPHQFQGPILQASARSIPRSGAVGRRAGMNRSTSGMQE